jgi:hypothetical protein
MVGNHIFRFEPPDIFWAKFRGPIMLEDAVRAVRIYQEMSDVRPFIFVGEMKELGRLDPEAGRYLGENLPSLWILGNIYIGTRLLHRALAKGIALASLLTANRDERAMEKIHFVSTPEQAHEVIAQLRARHRGAVQ